jgi:hypothetical protein
MRHCLRWLLLLIGLVLTVGSAGCANHIKDVSVVIWDVVDGTEKMRVDEMRVDGGTLEFKLRYTAEFKHFDVTQIYETTYRGVDELYEVPVGLVAIVPSMLWWGVSSVMGFTGEIARGPLDWSAAGLNPFMPVENGMFVERYSIREKSGSRRPKEGSESKPYDAVVGAHEGRAWVRIGLDPRNRNWTPVNVGNELLLRVNLLEATEFLSPETIDQPGFNTLHLRVIVKPSSEGREREKELELDLQPALVRELIKARLVVAELRQTIGVQTPEAQSQQRLAVKRLEDMGFGREALRLLR